MSERPLYYSKGRTIFRRPISTPREGAGEKISMGFPACVATEMVGEEGADALVQMLNKSLLTDAMEDELPAMLKNAFVAGCCAVLTWTKSGMPQDDLDEAGYDYAASVLGRDAA